VSSYLIIFEQFIRFLIPAIKSELPKLKILLNWMCGVEMSDGTTPEMNHVTKVTKKTPEEDALDAADFLYEPDWKKTVVDANAVVLMSVAMFFWGFYA